MFINVNLFWAFAYNIVVMPIVAGVFYNWGVTVSPVWSSIAMSGSSLLVVGFSQLLSFFHYDDSFLEGSSIMNKQQTIKYTQSKDSSRMMIDELEGTKIDLTEK
jgi:phosphatidylglycerophosphatase A